MQRPSKSRPNRPVGILTAWRLPKPGTALTPESASAVSSLVIAPQVLTGPTSMTSPPVDNSLIKTASNKTEKTKVPFYAGCLGAPFMDMKASLWVPLSTRGPQNNFPSWEANCAVKQETSDLLPNSRMPRVTLPLSTCPANRYVPSTPCCGWRGRGKVVLDL